MAVVKISPVQQKIACVYVCGISQEPSAKRSYQPFKVTALRELTPAAKHNDLTSALVTEKLDGTCCLIDLFQGKPCLWARFDRKPSKCGERRLAQFKKSKKWKEKNGESVEMEIFQWNPATDFKESPPNWIPASRLEVRDGIVLPNKIGHTPGWVPLEQKSREYCWHLQAVNLAHGIALVLREVSDGSGELFIQTEPLSSLCGQTCELIGTNVNGNPYGLGTKKNPLHLLIPHGSMVLRCPDPADYDQMVHWMTSGQVEGIVWHCPNGELHKLHRHHLCLKWPVISPRLSQLKIRVKVDTVCEDGGSSDTSLFKKLNNLNGHIFENFHALKDILEKNSQDVDS